MANSGCTVRAVVWLQNVALITLLCLPRSSNAATLHAGTEATKDGKVPRLLQGTSSLQAQPPSPPVPPSAPFPPLPPLSQPNASASGPVMVGQEVLPTPKLGTVHLSLQLTMSTTDNSTLVLPQGRSIYVVLNDLKASPLSLGYTLCNATTAYAQRINVICKNMPPAQVRVLVHDAVDPQIKLYEALKDLPNVNGNTSLLTWPVNLPIAPFQFQVSFTRVAWDPSLVLQVPAREVEIQLMSANGSGTLWASKQTDEHGNATFQLVPRAQYLATFKYPGLELHEPIVVTTGSGWGDVFPIAVGYPLLCDPEMTLTLHGSQGVFPSKGLGYRVSSSSDPTLFMGDTTCKWIIQLGAQPSISLMVDYPHLGANNTITIDADTGFSARLNDAGPGLFQKRVAASNVTIQFFGGPNPGFSNFTFGWQTADDSGGMTSGMVKIFIVACVLGSVATALLIGGCVWRNISRRRAEEAAAAVPPQHDGMHAGDDAEAGPVGVPPEVLALLKVRGYKKNRRYSTMMARSPRSGGGGGGTPTKSEPATPTSRDCCAICLDGYEHGELLKWLPCGHHYHIACIDEWLGKGTACPLCKRDVVSMARAVGLLPAQRSGSPRGGFARRLLGRLVQGAQPPEAVAEEPTAGGDSGRRPRERSRRQRHRRRASPSPDVRIEMAAAAAEGSEAALRRQLDDSSMALPVVDGQQQEAQQRSADGGRRRRHRSRDAAEGVLVLEAQVPEPPLESSRRRSSRASSRERSDGEAAAAAAGRRRRSSRASSRERSDGEAAAAPVPLQRTVSGGAGGRQQQEEPLVAAAAAGQNARGGYGSVYDLEDDGAAGGYPWEGPAAGAGGRR